jgi:hypothetical protein
MSTFTCTSNSVQCLRYVLLAFITLVVCSATKFDGLLSWLWAHLKASRCLGEPNSINFHREGVVPSDSVETNGTRLITAGSFSMTALSLGWSSFRLLSGTCCSSQWTPYYSHLFRNGEYRVPKICATGSWKAATGWYTTLLPTLEHSYPDINTPTQTGIQ